MLRMKKNNGKSWFSLKAQGNDAEIEIYDVIGLWGVKAADLIKQLKDLHPIKNLMMRISSPGGSIIEGFHIANYLEELRAGGTYITAKNMGMAASMGSFLMVVADKAIAPKNTMMMIHKPLSGIYGTAEDFKKEAEILDKLENLIVAAYRRHAKDLSEAEIREMLKEETYLTADEALEYGLIDEVIDPVEIREPVNFGGLKVTDQAVAVMLQLGIPFLKENHETVPAENNQPGPQRDGPKNGGRVMRFDALGNLVDETGKIVMTAEQVRAQMKIDPKATEAQRKEIEEAQKQALLDGQKAERNRQSEIKALCDGLELGDEFVNKLISDATSIEDARKLVIEKHKETMNGAGTATVTVDAADKRREGLINAILCRVGLADKEVVEKNRKSEFAGAGLQMTVRHCANAAGVKNAYTMESAAVGRLFLDLVYGRFSNGMGMNSNDLESVLSTVNDKALLRAFQETQVTYPLLTTTGNLNDIKIAERLKLSEAADVLEVPEGEAAKLSKISDKKETVQLKKYGRAWSTTEEMVINDDLGAALTQASKFGRAIPREINYQFWNTLVVADGAGAGPVIAEDGFQIFNQANHGNYPAAAAAISETTLGAAVEALMLTKLMSPDGGRSRDQYTKIQPKFLCVGPKNWLTAERYCKAPFSKDTATSQIPNPFYGMLTPIVEPLIQLLGANANKWLVSAAPQDTVAQVLTLTGRDVPQVQTKVGGAGEVKGLVHDIMHYWVVKFFDWRGFYMNKGA